MFSRFAELCLMGYLLIALRIASKLVSPGVATCIHLAKARTLISPLARPCFTTPSRSIVSLTISLAVRVEFVTFASSVA